MKITFELDGIRLTPMLDQRRSNTLTLLDESTAELYEIDFKSLVDEIKSKAGMSKSSIIRLMGESRTSFYSRYRGGDVSRSVWIKYILFLAYLTANKNTSLKSVREDTDQS